MRSNDNRPKWKIFDLAANKFIMIVPKKLQQEVLEKGRSDKTWQDR